MLANGSCGGGGLGAVAVMVGVDSASGGGSVSTVLHAVLALMLREYTVQHAMTLVADALVKSNAKRQDTSRWLVRSHVGT
jgi:ABC-type methionine transport system permease subunit